MTAAPPPLVLVAHGSKDPRFGAVVYTVAARLRDLARPVEVRAAYLEHGPPFVAEVAQPGAVAVPLLLSGGYHVHVDLPMQAPAVRVTAPVGPDPRIANVLATRLREAGYAGGDVTLAAAGSSDARARADVEVAAEQLAEVLGAGVRPAYVSAGEPRLSDVRPRAVASYLLAPGVFADAVAGCGASVIAEPIGAHPVLAEIAFDRYRELAGVTQPPGRTAPA